MPPRRGPVGDAAVPGRNATVSIPRFLVSREALEGRSTVLTGSELHHLRVRRLHTGSAVVLFDGSGQQRRAVVTSLDRRQASIRYLDDELAQAESPLHLVLAQAVLKPSRFDLVIEKATELGVNEIVAFTCERSIQSAVSERTARWSRIAASAAKQCQRATVPQVRGPVSFDKLLCREGPALRLLFWEGAEGASLPAVAQRHRSCTSVLAVIGPEGGFCAPEAARAAAAGMEIVRLGTRILRAETAAIIALALCQFLWGDLSGNAPR